MSWVQSPLFSSPPSISSPLNHKDRMSPALIFIVVILAAIFSISALLHLIIKYFMKQSSFSSSSSISQSNRYTEFSGSNNVLLQRQLQQLFNLHDSGLDQASIDALPLFQYKEILMGPKKEAFDCAVCLCEFSEQDKLRLLPLCRHAFHIDCIDKWLLSNSTCPLCRGTLFSTPPHELSIENNPNPVFYVDDDSRENGVSSGLSNEAENHGFSSGQKPDQEMEAGIVVEKRVFPVRLGKFRSSVNNGGLEEEEAESSSRSNSSSNLDGRRCYSMGSMQYVVDESDLEVGVVALGTTDLKLVKGIEGGNDGNSLINGDFEGKRLISRSRGESFSVSKIWLWSKKDKIPTSSDNFL